MQIFEINVFGGLNLKNDSRKIAPGEFTTLKNAYTKEGAIKADAVDALISMPVPVTLANHIGAYAKEVALGSAATSATGVTAAIYITGNFVSGDVIHFGVPRKVGSGTNGSQVLSSVGLYNGTTAGPSASIDSGYLNIVSINTLVSASAAPSGVVYEFYEAMVTGATSAMWIRVNGPTAIACGTSPTASTMVCGASGWASGSRFSCVVYKDSISAAGHVLNIVPVVMSNDQTRTQVDTVSGSNQITFPGWKEYYFSRTFVSGCAPYNSFFSLAYNGPGGNYTNSLAGISLINADSKRYSDLNFIQADKIFAFTHNESQNSVAVDHNHYQDSTYDLQHSTMRPTNKRSACFFNGYFIPARNGPLVAYKTAVALGNGADPATRALVEFPLRTPTFENPRIILNYNNYLMVFNVKDEMHRMYFSTAGAIDGFSATQKENMSDGEEVLWAEEWFGSIILFFSSKIKRYTGTPGNASLETIFYKGVPSAEVVCKTGNGIFFLTNDGLYVYNGSFAPVKDLSTKFDLANFDNVNQDGWLEYNGKKQELYFYEGHSSLINIWNTEYNYFRQKDYTTAVCTGEMRLFKYTDNMNLKNAISYPSITHVSEIEAGTTYQPVTAESGWIDPSEGKTGYDQKHFDSAIIEYKQASAAGTFDAYIYTDDLDDSTPAASASATSLSGSGSFGSLKLPINRDAKLFRYKLISPAQNAQLNVSKIKILYNDTILK